jgi:hypothetical protein
VHRQRGDHRHRARREQAGLAGQGSGLGHGFRPQWISGPTARGAW